MAVLPELYLVYWEKPVCNQFRNRVSQDGMSQMGSETLIHAFMISNSDDSGSLPPGLLQVSQDKAEIACTSRQPLRFEACSLVSESLESLVLAAG